MLSIRNIFSQRIPVYNVKYVTAKCNNYSTNKLIKNTPNLLTNVSPNNTNNNLCICDKCGADNKILVLSESNYKYFAHKICIYSMWFYIFFNFISFIVYTVIYISMEIIDNRKRLNKV